MKRRVITLALVALVALTLTLTACGQPVPIQSTDFHWAIIQSPITGRYYEVVAVGEPTLRDPFSISEVTKADYDRYIASKK